MNIFNKQKLFYQKGLTLVELMVSLTISSVLMLGVGTIYSSSKEANKVNDEFSILQENARLAFRFLTQDVRMAGYVGCAYIKNDGTTSDNFTSTLNSANLTPAQEDFVNGFGTGLEGYDATGTTPGSTLDLSSPSSTFNRTVNSLFTGHINGSDIIVVRHANGTGIKLDGNKNSANFAIQSGGSTTITNNCHVASGICENDILVVSDCSKARMFQATNITNAGGVIKIVHAASGTPGNTPSSWGGSSIDESEWFAPGDSEILKLGAYAYYIAIGTSGLPTLMRLSNFDAAPQELVEGVENMQILYGIDSTDDGRANQYVIAPTVVNTNVVSVRISLLMSTPNEIPNRPDDTKIYKMISENNAVNVQVTPVADRRIRKVFTTTIKLRNKGLVDE